MIRIKITVFALTALSFSVWSSPIQRWVPNAQLVGESRYTYLFWNVYDIALFAPNGDWQSTQPFALTLTYLRDFTGEQIAQRSLREMQKQGLNDNIKGQQWLAAMQEIFPDVEKYQTLTGVLDEQGNSHFYFNSELVGSVDDPEFGKRFFNIWLGENTSEPKLRQELVRGGN
ncbi:hypothetical protein DXV75_00620 [Alteromonas aestuariivivens]|uniref:Chalcone isomerase domain-containing protein n=1 Tax=Alteromonas aestuariivivens TaxID=1938339 RepID=A0A3D8MDT6_9ALTE|nr:chalcone isomerase family protein [Alteromonas aestuariivivens]RDV29005.1 hypothetical protein DXV75_00620 [Alteromonas aestuariivivens]